MNILDNILSNHLILLETPATVSIKND